MLNHFYQQTKKDGDFVKICFDKNDLPICKQKLNDLEDELKRKNENLQREKNDLKRERDNWRTEYYDKNRENEDITICKMISYFRFLVNYCVI